MYKKLIKYKQAIIAFILIVLNGVGASASSPWTVNPSDYRYDMSIYLDVYFASTQMDYSKYEVGVFCGDQCRGVAEVLDLGNGKSCLYLRARSNQESGETMTFKYYDKETQEISDIDGVSFKFESNGRLGYPSDPYIVKVIRHFNVELSAGVGGSINQTGGRIAEGTEINLVATPDEGYSFEKWSDNSTENPRTIIVNGDISLTAEFAVNSYKLTYVVDGVEYKSIEVKYGETLPEQEVPQKEGYTFSGWIDSPQTMPAHDLTISGSYTINSYRLVFMVGDEVISETTLEYGSKIVEPTVTELEGRTFNGWVDVPETMPAHDLTINGSYSLNKYKLSFVIGEETISEAEVEYGSPVTAVEAPEKEGYTFDGWVDVPQTMPAHDVTVTGSYTINSYRLVFMIGDEVISETTLEYGSKIVEPTVTELEGHTFDGWVDVPETMPAHDLTINGSYSLNKYKLSFVIGEDIISEAEVEYGSEVTAIEAPEKEGYTFDGWVDVPQTMPAHDVTVTGSYTINSYRLVFMIGEEVISDSTVEYASKIVEPTVTELEGHTFNGWVDVPETMPAHDLTINGSYSINKYKLSFVIGEETISEAEVEYGSEVTAIEAPEKEGYTFDGWVDVPETMPAQDVTVTGSYTINSYRLVFMIGDEVISESTVEYASKIVEPTVTELEGHTFNGWVDVPETMPAHDLTINGSYSLNKYKLSFVIGEDTISEAEVEYGSPVTAVEAPEKEGYTFDGWVDVPQTMPAHDVTVSGSYTINTYRLVFMIGDEVISDSTVEYASKIVEPTVAELEGRTFNGWVDVPETMPAHDLTINGSYSLNKYKLSFVIGEDIISEAEVEYGSPVTAVEAPEKEGYTFDGWVDVPQTMPAHDVTVSGSYTINSYTLIFKIGNDVISESVVEFGSVIVEPEAPEKEGYTFGGWEEHPSTMPARDLTINGYYEGESFILTFIIGEEVISQNEVEFGTPLSAIEAPEKEGYTFDGWSAIPQTMPAHDVTVTGSYTINSYKLIFVIGDEIVSESTVEYASVIEAPAAPEKEGHTFNGWADVPQTMPAKDLTINGSYSINKYKLTFVIGEDTVSEAEVEYGAAVTAVEAPQKEGYTFDGWVDVPQTMPAQDVTVTGSYTINSYRLVFMIGEEVISESTVEYATEIVAPKVAEKEGYTFSGWNDLPKTMPAKDLTITGSYIPNKYKLTYIIDDEVVSEMEVEYNSSIQAIDAPQKEGYIFDGWKDVPELMPSHDVTVTGSYSINSYTLIFKIGNDIISESVVEYGSVIVEPEAPEKEGFTFGGWDAHPATMPARDLVINGHYDGNSFKLTYVIDGKVVYESELEVGTILTAIEAPEKEGYTFDGWTGLPDKMPSHDVTVTGSYSINSYKLVFILDGKVISESTLKYGVTIVAPTVEEKVGYTFVWADLPKTMPAHDLTITGSYKINTYKIKFIIGEEVISESILEYGAVIVKPEVPQKEGYTFDGWATYHETMPDHDVVVIGSYSINSYVLTFKIGDEVISETKVEYGSAIVAPENPEKEGYTFTGWEEYPERMPAEDLTVNGHFECNTYTLTYVLDNEVISESEVEFGSPLSAVEVPEKEGYTFTGWVDMPQTMPAHDLVLTGSYTINSYRLVFMIGEEVISESTVEYAATIVEPAAPQKEGYTFDGWNDVPQTMPAQDVTVTGSYTVNSYRLVFMIGEEVISESTVEYAATIVEPTVPEREGYTFDGWNDVPQTMPAHDLTVTGSYSINSYSLIFKIGNEVVSETVVEFGSEIVEPQAPEKEGLTFAGWEAHPATMPAEDLIIYGHYEGNSYILTYILDGEVISQSEVEYGTHLSAIEAPEKEGYTFTGWVGLPETMPAQDVTVTGAYAVNSYTLTFIIGDDVVSESVVEFGSTIVEPSVEQLEGYTFNGWVDVPETMPAHDLTINGSYSINKYKLTFVIGEDTISEAEVEYGSEVTAIEAPEKEGYTFGGWNDVPETMPAHDVIVTGCYSINSYKLVFMIDDQVFWDTTVEYAATIVEPTAPEKEGYTFQGWIDVPEVMPAYDVTINGSYLVNKYKLTYVIENEIIYEAEIDFGEDVIAIEAPEKEGYTFEGWNNIPETMPAHDVIVEGLYQVNTYTVTYVLEDGTVVRTDEVEFGDVLPEAPEAPEIPGYIFRGWEEIPQTMPAEDIVIMAIYDKTSAVSNVIEEDKDVKVYDLRGTLISTNGKSLKPGIYIINGQKVLVK